mmetsp:Transcript_8116/g.17688  ORF Transcript_8116/g.17688 Transcript_8116/m.17688 type:complete len:214 (+) Transcript_8116:241-882(+)
MTTAPAPATSAPFAAAAAAADPLARPFETAHGRTQMRKAMMPSMMRATKPSKSQISHMLSSSFSSEAARRSGKSESKMAVLANSFSCHFFRSSLACSVSGVQMAVINARRPPDTLEIFGAARVLMPHMMKFLILASSSFSSLPGIGDALLRRIWALCTRQSSSRVPGSSSSQRWCRASSSISGCLVRFVSPVSNALRATSIERTLRSSLLTCL